MDGADRPESPTGVPLRDLRDSVAARRRAVQEEVPAALRRDVGLLGSVLGQVLGETGGPDLLADVERLRHATIALRAEPTEARRQAVVDVVAGFDLDRALEVARAFTVYFYLVNLAEERHRSRALHERGRGPEPVAESIEAAVARVRDREGEAVLDDLLGRLTVIPVLTAHPTEARRRSIIEALQRIAGLVEHLDDPWVTRAGEEDVRRRLLEEVTNLWRTEQLRPKPPAPLDEVRTALAMFDATIFRVVPLVYRELDRALSPEDVGTRPPRFPPFLRWGSWVGGDRDGNPSVTAEVTRATLAIQADHVLRGLENVTRRVARSVTATAPATPAGAELLGSIEADARDFPEAAASIRTRVPDQAHRHKLELMAERLVATRRGLPGRYPDAARFLEDLRLVQRSLADAGATRLAYGELQHLVWQAETFGFHLASLEVRQHSSVHTRALEELAPEAVGDAAALDRLASRGWPSGLSPRSGEATEALATFRTMAELQDRYGREACRRYVVSFTHSPADVVAVRALGRLAVPGGSLELDVVPLFESAADLRAAPDVLEDLFALPGMSSWLEGRGRRLEVMLGYSDSAKEMGFLAANVALYRAQGALAEWARRRGVALTLFHGRGGALGRGGGPANRAILSQAPGSVAGRLKMTEQGEVVFARYGNLEIARRHLEQLTNAVLVASTAGHEAGLRVAQGRHAELLEWMAGVSERAYRDLVGRPGFAGFFAQVTPIDEIEALQMGSRPPRRAPVRDLESLRAIPWVFAWTQSRINLPGWYGLGAALASAAEGTGGVDRLRAMYTDWPFFRSVLENAELAMVKADLPIARLYLALGDSDELAKLIEDEYLRTEELVLEVTGHEGLLGDRPLLRRAVELRNPYVDPLSFLQVRFLAELRSGALDPDREARARRLVLLTVNGVAAGLQDTG